MLRLARHIWTMGLKSGTYYWKVEKEFIRNPDFMLVWARHCEAKAQLAERDEEWRLSGALKDWAQELRKQHAKYLEESRKP
jgi:hypothetical protein